MFTVSDAIFPIQYATSIFYAFNTVIIVSVHNAKKLFRPARECSALI